MADLGDLARRGAVLVLAELARQDFLTMTEFASVAQLVYRPAKALAADLQVLGLVEVEVFVLPNKMERHEVRATRLGREVGKHLIAVEEILKRSR